jgi:hypothetical protein
MADLDTKGLNEAAAMGERVVGLVKEAAALNRSEDDLRRYAEEVGSLSAEVHRLNALLAEREALVTA